MAGNSRGWASIPREELLARLLRAAVRSYGRPGDSDFDEEEAHLADFAGKSELTPDEFEWIVEWKQERGFGKKVRGQNRPEDVLAATRHAFASVDVATAIDCLISGKAGGLKGVRYPTASAILTFHDPKRFTILDPRAWNSLYALMSAIDPTTTVLGREPEYDSGNVYAVYVSLCQTVAQQYGLSLRELDRGLFMLGGAPWVFDLLGPWNSGKSEPSRRTAMS